jgi:hypothetical protein
LGIPYVGSPDLKAICEHAFSPPIKNATGAVGRLVEPPTKGYQLVRGQPVGVDISVGRVRSKEPHLTSESLNKSGPGEMHRVGPGSSRYGGDRGRQARGPDLVGLVHCGGHAGGCKPAQRGQFRAVQSRREKAIANDRPIGQATEDEGAFAGTTSKMGVSGQPRGEMPFAGSGKAATVMELAKVRGQGRGYETSAPSLRMTLERLADGMVSRTAWKSASSEHTNSAFWAATGRPAS